MSPFRVKAGGESVKAHSFGASALFFRMLPFELTNGVNHWRSLSGNGRSVPRRADFPSNEIARRARGRYERKGQAALLWCGRVPPSLQLNAGENSTVAVSVTFAPIPQTLGLRRSGPPPAADTPQPPCPVCSSSATLTRTQSDCTAPSQWGNFVRTGAGHV